MSKRERIARLELQVADLNQEVAALRQMLASKQDRQPVYQPAPRSPLEAIGPGRWLPNTNPYPDKFPPFVVTCEAKTGAAQ